jgi:hypothetical protein
MHDCATSIEFDHIDGAFFICNKMTTGQKDDLTGGTETYKALRQQLILDRRQG